MNFNSSSYGIGLFGHGDKQPITPAQIESVKSLICHLLKRGLIAADYEVRGHREVSKKSCPGNLVYGLVTNGTWANLDPADDLSSVPAPDPGAIIPAAPAAPGVSFGASNSSAVHFAYLVHLGRYASPDDVAYWGPQLANGGETKIAGSDEAKMLASDNAWLERISKTIMVPGVIEIDYIMTQMTSGRMSRAQVVNGLLGIGLLREVRTSDSANISLDDIAAALAERLMS